MNSTRLIQDDPFAFFHFLGRRQLDSLRILVVIAIFSVFNFTSVHAAEAMTASLTSCRVEGFAQQVQCGQLQRPLNPDQPLGKQITLHFIVLSAKDKSTASEPIFLLAGGPGQSAINVASWMQILFEKLQRGHDLVFVDQRGTGSSAPLLCPENNDLAGIGDANFVQQQILKCKTQLEKLPYGDLRFFTTSIAMQDLDAVRDSLHYSRINLIGISYGTRAALEYQRQFPQYVRRSILDGVVQPDDMLAEDDLQKALASLFSACALDHRCQQAYPNLPQDWKKLLASLPQQAQLTHPRLGSQINATVRRDDVLAWVSQVLYSPVNSAGLPGAIEQAVKGNFNSLLALSGAGNLTNPGSIAYGMHFSVMCAEENEHMQQHPKPAADNDFGDLHNQLYLNVCKVWPHGQVPKDFYQVAVSTTPVLLLSGGLDPVTPPWHAQKVAQALGPNARHIVLNNSGHGMLQQSCLADIATQFINAKTDLSAQQVDVSCVKQIPRPSVWIAPHPQLLTELYP